MLNELEQKIRKAIPELMELGVGCQYGYNNEPLIEVIQIENNSFTYLNLNNKGTCFIEIEEFNRLTDLNLIGKPIQLNHVLYYFLQFGVEYSTMSSILSRWNLKSNLLSNQSEELIKYLNEL